MSDTVVTAKFVADTSSLQAGARKVTGSLQNVQNDVQKSAKGFTMLRGAVGAAFGVAAVAGIAGAARALTNFTRESVAAAQESQMTVRRLEAIARSMGILDTTLGGTTDRLQDYATTLMRQTGVNDETIKSAQALILTFKDVAASAGETGGMFDRATAAALDLSAAGFGDVERNAKSLARALQDPVKGLSMLSRSGVTFTAQEKEKIKALVESNRLLEAQEIIMSAVETQVGGTAAATATSTAKMAASFGEVQESIGFALLPTIESIAGSINTYVMPALEEMAAEASANGPEMASAYQDMVPTLISLGRSFLDIAGQIRTAMQPALQIITRLLQAVVPVVEMLAKAIGAIPGPIMAMVGALVVLRMGLMQTFVRTMNTATKTTVLSFATMRTSAATMAAGIRASFIAAGTAVKGFMASLGPVGWALIGASAAFEIFSGRSAATEDLIMRLKETVDEATGAFTELSQVAMATQFRLDLSPSDAAMLAAMGLSVDEAAAAITKGGDAVAEFQAKIDAAQSSMSTGLLPNETAATLLTFERNFQGMADTAVATQERVRAELDSTAAAQARNTSATVSAAIAAGNAIGPTSGLSMSIGGLGDEAGEAATEIDAMRGELETWLSVTGQIAAVDRAAESIDNLGAASVEFGTNLMGQTPKARDFRAEVISAFEDSAAAAASLSDDLPTQRAIFTGELVKIVNALKTSGVKPRDIEDFLGAMDGLPASVADIMRAAAKAVGDTDFKSEVERAFDKSVKAGTPMTADTMEKLAQGASKAAKEKLGLTLEPELGSIIKSATTALRPTAFNNGELTGKSIGSGAAYGINQSSPIVIAAVERVMAQAKAAADAAVESDSPSRLFARTGDDMAAGVAMGFTRSSSTITTAITAAVPRTKQEGSKLAKALAEGFREAMLGESGGFASAIQSIFGSIPTKNPIEQILGSEGAQKFIDNNKKGLQALLALAERFDAFIERLGSSMEAVQSLADMTARAFGRPSEIMETFGAGTSTDAIIDGYLRLRDVIKQAYSVLTDASIVGKRAAQANRREMQGLLSQVRALAEESLRLQRQYEANLAALEQNEKDYQEDQRRINERYDALEQQAKDRIKEIETYWNGVIPGLEAALSAATAAYERENGVLQGLIKERDGFLSQIRDGARSFVNSLSFTLRDAAGSTNAATQRVVTREIRELANGIRVTVEREMNAVEDATGEAIGNALTGGDVRTALQDRLTQVRSFAANIRTLVARGLDPELVKEFVAAGVSGAGAAAQALATASDSDIQAINQVQQDLAAELADYAGYVSQEWHALGIAQQEAVVGPLRMAQENAQQALNLANTARAQELTAAQAHLDKLTEMRRAELKKAEEDYNAEKKRLEDENKAILARQDEIAQELQNLMARLNRELAAELQRVGNRFARGILDGFKQDYPELYRQLNKLMDDLAKSMSRTATLTVQVVYDYGTGGGGDSSKSGNTGLTLGASPRMAPLTLGTPPPMTATVRTAPAANVNINVNAGMGADGSEIGRQVVDALRQYERRNGPIPVSVSG